jgi:hypothetical protein
MPARSHGDDQAGRYHPRAQNNEDRDGLCHCPTREFGRYPDLRRRSLRSGRFRRRRPRSHSALRGDRQEVSCFAEERPLRHHRERVQAVIWRQADMVDRAVFQLIGQGGPGTRGHRQADEDHAAAANVFRHRPEHRQSDQQDESVDGEDGRSAWSPRTPLGLIDPIQRRRGSRREEQQEKHPARPPARTRPHAAARNGGTRSVSRRPPRTWRGLVAREPGHDPSVPAGQAMRVSEP